MALQKTYLAKNVVWLKPFRAKKVVRPATANGLGVILHNSLMFFIAYALNGQVHVFTGRVKIVSHSSCRTSTILK